MEKSCSRKEKTTPLIKMLEIHSYMCKIRIEIHISEVLEQKRRGIVKKKKILTEVFVLFFVAAVFMAVYVVIEMGNDWLAVLGGAAVLLISAYLLTDYLLESKAEGTGGASDEKLSQRIADLEEVQKAIYTVLKRGNSENAELLHGLDARLTELIRAMSQMVDTTVTVGTEQQENQKELLQAVKGMRQDYQVGIKNLIKYEKENARQVAETAHTNTEMTLIELNAQFAKILESLQDQKEQIAFLRLSTMSAPFSIPNREDGQDDSDEEVLLPILDDALIPVEEPKEEPAEHAEFAEDAETDEFDAEAAIKAYMAEQGFDIEDEESDAVVEETPEEPEEKSAPMSEEEIANTLQSMASGDPNRALTPEEIAAMFAAVQ